MPTVRSSLPGTPHNDHLPSTYMGSKGQVRFWCEPLIVAPTIFTRRGQATRERGDTGRSIRQGWCMRRCSCNEWDIEFRHWPVGSDGGPATPCILYRTRQGWPPSGGLWGGLQARTRRPSFDRPGRARPVKQKAQLLTSSSPPHLEETDGGTSVHIR